VRQYEQRLSGPLLDRVDIQLFVPRLSRAELMDPAAGESSDVVRERVEAARERQRARLDGTPWWSNAQMPGTTARRLSGLNERAWQVLSTAVESLSLSGRGFDRAIRVGRTIADLAGSEGVDREHVSEALGYRAMSAEGEVASVG